MYIKKRCLRSIAYLFCHSLFPAIFSTLSLCSKMNNLGSPNPNFNNFSYFPDHNIDHHQHQSSEFELSDYLLFDDHHHGFDEDAFSSQSKASSDKIIMGGSSSGATSEKNNMRVTYIYI